MKFSKILLSLLLFISCSDVFEDQDIYGCNDLRACNYNSNVTNYWEGSCEYPEDIYGGSIGDFSCNGECLVDFDCNGDCGGNIIDSDGDNICDDIDICVGNFSEIYEIDCFDLQALDDIKKSNVGSDLDSLELIDVINLNCNLNDYGRIKYLSLSSKNIFNIPTSIQDLDFLEKLYINDNNLTSLPNSICNINSSCEIYVQDNNLCPEYEYDCIDHWGEQNCDD